MLTKTGRALGIGIVWGIVWLSFLQKAVRARRSGSWKRSVLGFSVRVSDSRQPGDYPFRTRVVVGSGSKISCSPAGHAGVSTGDVLSTMEKLAQDLPRNMTSEWTELSYLQKLSGKVEEFQSPGGSELSLSGSTFFTSNCLWTSSFGWPIGRGKGPWPSLKRSILSPGRMICCVTWLLVL